ncbi:hypothetical protein AWZ03_002266 [Drosophila navojoa]|uniref:Transmembrane protein 188 n=1 Tax=Drosophila navojoa TaxID=7232 RepID=A0A484BQT5_DRONA|nr:hypothetical protein AWZ03_002266 [Drosophila navojoa]
MEPSACEDLKAFERRLTEVVSSYRPPTNRWRIILSALSVCTAISAWYWLKDPRTTVVPLTESLWIHPIFTVATVTLIILFIFGIQKLVVAPQIITSRTRSIMKVFFLLALLMTIVFSMSAANSDDGHDHDGPHDHHDHAIAADPVHQRIVRAASAPQDGKEPGKEAPKACCG